MRIGRRKGRVNEFHATSCNDSGCAAIEMMSGSPGKAHHICDGDVWLQNKVSLKRSFEHRAVLLGHHNRSSYPTDHRIWLSHHYGDTRMEIQQGLTVTCSSQVSHRQRPISSDDRKGPLASSFGKAFQLCVRGKHHRGA